MRKRSKMWRACSMVAFQAMLFGFGGGCLPDNLLADTAGEIVRGLLISTANTALADAGG